jgi:hypothetical protein
LFGETDGPIVIVVGAGGNHSFGNVALL